MRSYSIASARSLLAEAIDACGQEPVQITRHGKAVAVLVEPGIYERLLDAFEELEDIEAFDAAQALKSKRIPWDQIKSDLGLS